MEKAAEATNLDNMATFLDVSGLQHFSSIFVFLFVWIVVYATLLWTKILGQNNFVNVLVGLLLGLFVLISPLATDVIAGMAPFLAVVFVFIILISMAAKMLGGDAEAFPALKGILIVVIVIIVLVGVAVKIKEKANLEQASGKEFSSTVNLIFNPTFLGTILVFAIAVFTIALLASRSA